jgi:hypothetical protein
MELKKIILKKISILKIYQSKFNKKRQIKRIEITWVNFKINEKFNRKKKNNIAQSSIE